MLCPTVQECYNCIPKLETNTFYSGSPLVYNPSVGGYVAFIGGTGLNNINYTMNTQTVKSKI